MSVDSNPFRAPVARVHDHIESVMGNFIPEGRRVPTGNGYQWLLRGWQMFRSAPGTWVGISVALIAIMMVIGMIPVVNLAVNLVGPVFIGGIIIGCRAIEEGEGLRFAHLFAGFSTRLGGLLLVGLLYLLAVLGAAAIFGIIVAVGAFAGAGASEPTLAVIIVAVLVLMVVFVPLAMAVWLAPPLVVFHDFSAFQALKASFFAALRNSLPFLVYGLCVLLAAIVACLPLFLGWLVLVPVLYASMYAFYRDVFFEP